MSFKTRAGLLRLILFLVVSGCSTGSPTPSTGLPTFGAQQATVASPNTLAATPVPADRVWATKPFGADQVAIVFSEPHCVGYQFTNAQAVTTCGGNGIVVVIQIAATDSTGKPYTLIAGRILSDKVNAVAAELDNAENTPMQVTDGGFAVVLPGSRRLVAVVPIDQYGYLVGARYIVK